MKTIPSSLKSMLIILALVFIWLTPTQAATTVVPPQPGVPLIWIVVPPAAQPDQPVQLGTMTVSTRIVGLQVEVSTDLTFFNPNQRVLEGELQFPLPNGAVITGYAIDVNGQMVDGVIVKKDQARVAFETEVRLGVDPGIVEYVAGNLYKTRIYPLPAQGTRRVRVKYVAQLPVDDKGDAAWLSPMPLGATVGELNIRVEISQGVVQPISGGFGNLRFQTFDNLWVAETKLTNAKPGEDLWVALPKLPPQVTTLEKVADGDVYFALSDLYTPPSTTSNTLAVGETLGIAWDASGSRSGEHLQREIAALKKLGLNLSVLIFRDRPEVIGPLTNPDILKDIAYDGGTDLIAAAAAISSSNIQRWLLFTDGLDTLNNQLPNFGGKDVTAVISQTLAHRELLRQICTNVVDLQQLSADVILTPPVRLLKVVGADVFDVQGINSNATGRVNVYGKLVADSTELRLVYSDGHESPPVKLSKQTATNGTLVASVWAAQRVNQLGVRADDNADELLALGRRFGIVSPVTSLIVLENLEQYVRNDIEPPASLPTLRQQWRASKANTTKTAQEQRISKIDRVLTMWQDRVTWWNNVPEVAKKFKHQPPPEPAPVEGLAAPSDDYATTNSRSRRRAAESSDQIAFDGSPPPSASAPMSMQEEQEETAVHSRRSLARRYDSTASDESRGSRRRSIASASRGPRYGGAGGGGGGGGAASGFDESPGGAASDFDGSPGGAASGFDERPRVVEFAAVAPNGDATEPQAQEDKQTTIAIKAWDPTTPYLKALKAALPANRYQVYLEQRKQFVASPAFFVDCAEFFLTNNDIPNGMRILTNLAELKLEEASLLRVLAWRLQQAGELERAIVVLRKVQKLRSEEPQSYRDLALALAEQGKYPEAMELLVKVVMGEWQRFNGIEVIALEELNALIARHHLTVPASMDPRLVKNLDVDVRIVMVWDADNTDVDLHVVDPSGEEANYSHNRTTIGGLVSTDFTRGYGPEEYMVRRAIPGPFKIFAHYYGSSQQTVIGPCTITATVFTDFGRPTQTQQTLTLRVDKPHDKADIGEIRFNHK